MSSYETSEEIRAALLSNGKGCVICKRTLTPFNLSLVGKWEPTNPEAVWSAPPRENAIRVALYGACHTCMSKCTADDVLAIVELLALSDDGPVCDGRSGQ